MDFRKRLLLLFMSALLVLLAGIFPQRVTPQSQSSASQLDNSWPSYRHDSRNTGFSEGEAPDTNQTAWRSFVGEDSGTGPIVAYGNVFYSGYKSNLTVIDEQDGSLVWTKNVPTYGSDPTISGDVIYVGTLGGEVLALNRITGDEIWRYQIYGYGQPLFNPQVADGQVFFNNRDGWLFCLNALTSQFLWKYETRLAEMAYMAVADGRVFTMNSCLNETDGTLLWQYGYEPAYIHWTNHSPTVDNGKVFLSIGPSLRCLDEFNGSQIWRYDTVGDKSDSAVAYGKVFVSSSSGYVYCLNEEYGQLEWQSYVGLTDGYSGSSPSVADNKVFISVGRNLTCLNVNNGDLVWNYLAPHWLHPPVVADGMVFVSWPGGVYAFGESTIPDVEFVSYNIPDSVLVSGGSQSFKVAVNVKNVGKVEAKNVKLDFHPSWGDVSLISSDLADVPPGQTRSLSIELNAANTEETHQADIILSIVYETPQGKAFTRDSSSPIGPPSFFITIVPVPAVPFYLTPFGIIAIFSAAFIAGVAVTAIFFKKRRH